MPHVDEGRLTAWLDGALAPGDAGGGEVERHLAVCGDCRRRLEEVRDLRVRASGILAAADLPVAPAPDFERLMARARAEAGRGSAMPRRSHGRRRWSAGAGTGLAWAASLALAVGAGWIARDLSVRRGAGIPPSLREPVPGRQEAAPGVASPADERVADAVAASGAAARSAADAAKAGRIEAADGPLAAAEAAPAPAAELRAQLDPFHAPPATALAEAGAGSGRLAVGCWARIQTLQELPLPESIRLTEQPATDAAGGDADAAGDGLLVRSGPANGVVARWEPFGPDSVWIGGEGLATMRLGVENDRLEGRAMARAGRPGARVDEPAGSGEPVPVAWRRVPCAP